MNSGLGHKGDGHLVYTDNIENLLPESDLYLGITERQLKDFVNKLITYGLQEHEVVVVVDRFVFSKTIAEITKDHGFIDPRTTSRVFKGALKKAEKAITYLKELKG